jgi:hypothetical protein
VVVRKGKTIFLDDHDTHIITAEGRVLTGKTLGGEQSQGTNLLAWLTPLRPTTVAQSSVPREKKLYDKTVRYDASQASVKASVHYIESMPHSARSSGGHADWQELDPDVVRRVLNTNIGIGDPDAYNRQYLRMIAATEEYLRMTASRFPGLSERLVQDMQGAYQTLAESHEDIAHNGKRDSASVHAMETTLSSEAASVCPRCLGPHTQTQCREACILCSKGQGHAEGCPAHTAREVKSAVPRSILSSLLSKSAMERQQDQDELNLAARTMALLLEAEGEHTMAQSVGRQIPLRLTDSQVVQAAKIYAVDTEDPHANLHMLDDADETDVERFLVHYTVKDSPVYEIDYGDPHNQPSTSTGKRSRSERGIPISQVDAQRAAL